GAQLEPKKIVRPEGKDDRRRLYFGKRSMTEKLYRNTAGKCGEIELRNLGKARQVRHHQDHLLLVAAQIGEHLGVFRLEKFNRPMPERSCALPHSDESPHPPKKRGRVPLLILHI